MPDSPLIGGGPGDAGGTPANSRGVQISAAAANTKNTTWTTLIASTSYASDWLMVELCAASSAAGYLVDIGIGASTAEQALISNLYVHSPTGATNSGSRGFLFPLRIGAGVRLSARCQNSSGAGNVNVSARTIARGIASPPGFGRVETIGADTSDSNGTSIDAGGTANTDVVGQLSAAIGFAYRWMCISIANPTDVAWAGQRAFLIDIVKGGAGSEVAVINDLYVEGSVTDDRPSPAAICFPCSIPAGERVGARVRCSVSTVGDRVLDIVGYGVG